MDAITTADLLQLQEAINGTIRHEVGQLRTELADVKDGQHRHEREIARLKVRTRGAARRVVNSLTPKQKAALWSGGFAAAGVVIDGLRHIGVAIATLYAKGVRLP